MGYIRIQGTELYYEERGDGPPILLIPPSGATASTWGALVDELAVSGHVITYDRRGYSRSGGGVVRAAEVHTADAASLLTQLGSAPAVVVGISAGATIALDLAVRRPDLVRAVVTHEAPWRALLHPDVSSLAMLANVQWLAWRGRHDEAAAMLLRHVYAYRDGGSAWDAFPDEWRRIATAYGRSVIADLKATLRSYPRRSDLARLAMPVICTYGSRSGLYMHAITRGLASGIPGATICRIDGSAHAVSFDAPATFANVIVDAAGASGIPAPVAGGRGGTRE